MQHLIPIALHLVKEDILYRSAIKAQEKAGVHAQLYPKLCDSVLKLMGIADGAENDALIDAYNNAVYEAVQQYLTQPKKLKELAKNCLALLHSPAKAA